MLVPSSAIGVVGVQSSDAAIYSNTCPSVGGVAETPMPCISSASALSLIVTTACPRPPLETVALLTRIELAETEVVPSDTGIDCNPVVDLLEFDAAVFEVPFDFTKAEISSSDTSPLVLFVA
jgi:hypothetical protein